MPITQRHNKYQVTVNRASAQDGFKRIRKFADTEEAAEALEREINLALDTYGHWPITPGADPIVVPSSAGRWSATIDLRTPRGPTGTLRQATELALETHWKGMRYCAAVEGFVWTLVAFFEGLGKRDIDDIVSADIDAFVKACREKGNAPGYISQKLGALRIINKVALARRPALATVTLPMPTVRGRKVAKWWLRPEDHIRTVRALRSPLGIELPPDPMFADLIDMIVYQGLRVEEAMRLTERHFSGLGTDKPWLQVPGTKTQDSQNAIPVYTQTLATVQSCIQRQRENKWDRFFPITARQARDRWNQVREFLGASDIPTATMKSLRRTFAWYANAQGMPTATLQKVLRHRGIGTTSGYLDLMGSGDVDRSREYLSSAPNPTTPKTESGLAELLQAFRATGATPEEVARFAKELMT